MKSALTFIGFLLLAMGLFWAGQGADLIRWPAESFMVNARQWILLRRRHRRDRACPDPAGAPIIAIPFHPIFSSAMCAFEGKADMTLTTNYVRLLPNLSIEGKVV
jgi:hypothetical protein